MRSAGTLWHIAALLISVGCYVSHGRPGESREPSPHDAHPYLDAQPEDPDAGDGCEIAIAHYRSGRTEPLACSGWPDHPPCMAQVNPCCQVLFRCEAGGVTRLLMCEDSCAQGCSTYTHENCALDPGCEWLDGVPCASIAPEGVRVGPECIERRGPHCLHDSECPAGSRCQEFWVAPACHGTADCACAIAEGRCAL